MYCASHWRVISLYLYVVTDDLRRRVVAAGASAAAKADTAQAADIARDPAAE